LATSFDALFSLSVFRDEKIALPDDAYLYPLIGSDHPGPIPNPADVFIVTLVMRWRLSHGYGILDERGGCRPCSGGRTTTEKFVRVLIFPLESEMESC
jgi:hypothetical protein